MSVNVNSSILIPYHKERSERDLHNKIERTIDPAWIELTVICIPIAFILGPGNLEVITSIAGDFIDENGVRHITEDYLTIRFFIPIAGFLSAIVPYLNLQRYLPTAGWLIGASTAGWTILGLITGSTLNRFELMAAGFFLARLTAVRLGLFSNNPNRSTRLIRPKGARKCATPGLL